MNKKAFIIMTLVAVFAAGLAWWLSVGRQPSDTGVTGNALFPGLDEQVNDVSKITVQGPGNTAVVTLHKSDDSWTVEQSGGYRADWSQVRNLLRGLARAEVVERKTSRPEWYSRLGVDDIDSEEATGLLVQLDDNEDLALIIGDPSSDNGIGRYVRKVGEAQAVLVDEALEVARQSGEWIDKNLIEFDAERITEMYIRHADGEVLHAERIPMEEAVDRNDFVLRNVPEGREVGSPWSVNSMPNTISSVIAEDVRRPAGELPDDALNVLFVADNGLNIQLAMYQEDDNHWMRASANAEPADATLGDDDAAPAAGDDDAMSEADTMAADHAAEDGEADTAMAEAPPPDPAEEARQFNERLSDWEFRIAEFKYNSWNKRVEDLLKPLEDETSDTTDDGDQG